MITSNKSLREGAAASGRYADEAADAAAHALDSTRQFANQAFEKAGEKVRDMRYGVQEFASRGVSTVSDATSAAQKQLGRYVQATGRYVAEEPVKTALIAAAVGAIVAAIVLAARRNRDY
ncbi:MAG: hypothetical protein ABIU58_06635 [Ramlibacter sp.]